MKDEYCNISVLVCETNLASEVSTYVLNILETKPPKRNVTVHMTHQMRVPISFRMWGGSVDTDEPFFKKKKKVMHSCAFNLASPN